MAGETTSYKCPACGGPLRFSSASGRLECEFCGSSFAVEEIDPHTAPENAEDAWDTSELSADWGGDEARLRTFNCPSCGARLICDNTTVATCCPYCGSPTMIPGQFDGSLRPDYVIPFKVGRETAVEELKKHYKGKIFLPRRFKRGNRIEQIQGLYVPFWLFDAEVETDCEFDGQKRIRSGREKGSVQHYNVRRTGSVRFERIPVDASAKLEDDLLDSILPYRYRSLKKFSFAYLAGYMADRPDVSVEDCAERMEQQVMNSAIKALEDNGSEKYDSMVLEDYDIYIHRGKVRCALLPVWILGTEWRGNKYIFAMNGQTGKFAGDLPVSMPKFWAFLLGLTAIIGSIVSVIMQLRG